MDASYNPLEQKTRAQRIPQSMELSAIKDMKAYSLKVNSKELLIQEPTNTVKYLSSFKETVIEA